MNKKLYVLHAHDNQYKSTITAIAYFLLYNEDKSQIDTLDLNNLKRNIDVLKNNKDKRIYHFADIPKNIYAEISGNKEFLNPENRIAKEIHRKQFVEWVEYQKQLFGQDVWARKVVNQINKKAKSKNYNKFWIGDLRFFVEIEEIQKNIHKNFNVEFIWVDTNKSQNVYYKKDNINTNNFQHKVVIDKTLSYNEIIESIYWQLKDIL